MTEDIWIKLPNGSQTTIGTNHRFPALSVARMLIDAGIPPGDAITVVREKAHEAQLAEATEEVSNARDYLADAERRLAFASVEPIEGS